MQPMTLMQSVALTNKDYVLGGKHYTFRLTNDAAVPHWGNSKRWAQPEEMDPNIVTLHLRERRGLIPSTRSITCVTTCGYLDFSENLMSSDGHQ